MITFPQTCRIFLGAFFAYWFVIGILTLHSCASAPGAAGVVGATIGAAAEGASGFVHGLVARGTITAADGNAWTHFIDTTVAAVDAATSLSHNAHDQAIAAQQSAGTAQLATGGVGVAALVSDQIHKAIINSGIPDAPAAKAA